MAVVHFHAVAGHIKGHVGHMQEVVGEILLDDIPTVTQADDEVIHAVGGVHLHDVPKNGPPAHFDHGLGPQVRLFGDAGTKPSREQNSFHGHSIFQYHWLKKKNSHPMPPQSPGLR